eukprot:2142181-Prymnesium_polylepis.1
MQMRDKCASELQRGFECRFQEQPLHTSKPRATIALRNSCLLTWGIACASNARAVLGRSWGLERAGVHGESAVRAQRAYLSRAILIPLTK